MKTAIEAMELAYIAARNSKDPSSQTGAVLLGPDESVIGVGFNDFPPGVDPQYWDIREEKYKRVVHAEVAAIIDAAKGGNSTLGSTLVGPWMACSNCAKHIAQAGGCHTDTTPQPRP